MKNGLLQWWKTRRNTTITLLFVPDARSAPRAVKFRFGVLLNLLFLCLLCGSVTAGFITLRFIQAARAEFYLEQLQKADEQVNRLTSELQTERHRLEELLQRIQNLQQQVEDLKAISRQIGTMLGKDLTGDDGLSARSMAAGRGGYPARKQIQIPGWEPTTSAHAVTMTFLARMDSTLHSLEEQIPNEQRHLQYLKQTAERYRHRRDHTPSIWPVKGRVTSSYGMRWHPIFRKRLFHTGIDIVAATGTPIRAAAAGTVSFAGEMDGYGLVVELEHGYGLETLYGHCSRLLVRPGQKVQKGDVIALVGNTGLSTGPHLHYEVKRGGRPVNPREYLK